MPPLMFRFWAMPTASCATCAIACASRTTRRPHGISRRQARRQRHRKPRANLNTSPSRSRTSFQAPSSLARVKCPHLSSSSQPRPSRETPRALASTMTNVLQSASALLHKSFHRAIDTRASRRYLLELSHPCDGDFSRQRGRQAPAADAQHAHRCQCAPLRAQPAAMQRGEGQRRARRSIATTTRPTRSTRRLTPTTSSTGV